MKRYKTYLRSDTPMPICTKRRRKSARELHERRKNHDHNGLNEDCRENSDEGEMVLNYVEEAVCENNATNRPSTPPNQIQEHADADEADNDSDIDREFDCNEDHERVGGRASMERNNEDEEFFQNRRQNNEPDGNENYNFGENNIEDEMIHRMSHITKSQAKCLIMAYALRYHLPTRGLQELLDLINCFMPQPVFPSLYLFLKAFPTQSHMTKHYFCSSCDAMINFKDSDEVICACNAINSLKSLDSNGKFFLTTSIALSIKKVLSNSKVASSLNKARDTSDVRSGKICQKLAETGVIAENDITLQFNTDGAQIFHTSKIGNSLWPIQIAINELPYKLRRANLILAGLWLGTGSPRMDVYLRPLVDELKELERDGIEISFPDGRIERVKVHCIVGCLDSPARSKVSETTQFNGEFGCSYCTNQGKTVRKGKGWTRIYHPYIGKLRTEREVLDQAKQGTSQDRHQGVKGFSILAELQTFNVVRSFVPDYLHGILLGAVPTVVDLWFLPSCKKDDWFIGNRVGEINQRLKSSFPSSEITRLPGKIELRSLWKGSEWRTWLIYYSLPVLKDILPEIYYNHWFLLVAGTRLLLQDHVSQNDIAQSRLLFNEFVQQMMNLYGEEHMSFNIHLLLHMPRYAKDWGALWATSTFIFEHGNGVLLTYVNGTRSATNQIFWKYDCHRYLINIAEYVFSENTYGPAALLAKKLIEGEHLLKRSSESHRVIFLGSGKPVNVDAQVRSSILPLIRERSETPVPENVVLQVQSWHRFIFLNTMYCGSAYTREYRRNNSIIQLEDMSFVEISHILNVCWDNETLPIVVGKKLYPEAYTLAHGAQLNVTTDTFTLSVVRDPTDFYFLSSNIDYKCLEVIVNDKIFVTPIVNIFETD